MTEPATTVETAAEPASTLTDDHAAALLADAVAVAESESGTPSGDDDSTALKAEIAKLRKENASSRVQAKQNAAEEARAEMAQQIGKALGIVTDDAPPDPVKLTEQLTAQTAAAKQAQIELAVYRAAGDAKADPAALLDSRAFLEKVAQLDPADSSAFATAITEAVTVNPRLGAATATGSPTGMRANPAQGASASPPLGLDAQIEAAKAAGDMKGTIRLKSAKALGNN